MKELIYSELLFAILPERAVKEALEADENKEFLSELDNSGCCSGHLALFLMMNMTEPELLECILKVYFTHFKKNNPLKDIVTGKVMDTGKKKDDGRSIVELEIDQQN